MKTDMNSKEPQAAAEMLALGRALRPTLADMSATLRSSPPLGGDVATAESVEDHLAQLEDGCDFEGKIEKLQQATAAGSDELAIHRAVGAFEAHLQVLLDGYMEVLAWGGARSARRGRDLLAEVYRHPLAQIKNWIAEIVATVEEPLAAVKRRGLQTQRDVTLTIKLTLRPSPELGLLMRWAEENAASKEDGIGFWGIVAGTVLGIGIADLLFLEDE